ncbi:MAG: SIS domain-containing protein [Chloroflexi bacterium]|nr:SIS domain-containing protein [Chloroflexota bacterium]
MSNHLADAPLPGPPDPWASTDRPSPRDGPPWHMTEMVAAEPGLARRLLRNLADPAGPATVLASRLRETAAGGRPIVVTGCGTSEHGALAVAEVLRDGFRGAGLPSALGAGGAPVAVQAFEAALDAGLAGAGSLVIAVSHEGATWATNRALDAAQTAGATTALITVSSASPGAALADIVIATDELDQSWCHTIGYLAPILAAAAVAGHVTGSPPDGDAAHDLLAAGTGGAAQIAAEKIAPALSGIDRLIVLGTGIDRIAARELTLKVEEGAHLPAAMRDLETMLHGHLAGVDERTGVVLVLTERGHRGARTARAIGALKACRELGMPVAAIIADVVDEAIDALLTPAGRIVLPDPVALTSPVASLLGTAAALQVLTLALALDRGVDPDPIRRDDPRYLAAADAAG